uniref:Uncharacterized protein n=1 Tax=Strigamia maritima TaxID=126957 RepID=T1IXD3_STRMM
MKLLIHLLALATLFAICEAQETEWTKILSLCYYYDDIDEVDKFKDCCSCVSDAFPTKYTTTDEDIKKCMDKLPERFASCTTKACLLQNVQPYRLENQKRFKKLHKEVLSRGELTRLFQVWGGFFMFFSMTKDLPRRSIEHVVEPAKKCFDPLKTDLSTYDEPATEALEESRSVRAATEAEGNDRLIVKNTYRRIYRLYLCCIKEITEEKEAKSIVRDFMRKYQGFVPAK